MAQTPHQQIQVVQQQPVSSTQLQQLYFPHQQVLFPGNIALQQASSGQPALQSIAPNRSFSNTSVGVLPKSIQSPALPIHSIAGQQRQLGGHQITTQAAGTTFQPTNFLGSFATLSPLPVGYQWATNCYQQNPIIIRSQHPNIYVQPQTAIQLPISAGQQIVTPTSYASNPHIQLETQTIATQTLVPSVTAVNSSNAFIQLDPNVPPVTKPSPSTSPSSSTPEVSNVQIQSQTNQPLLLSTQSLTHHILDESNGILSSVTETEITEIQSTEIQSEFVPPEKELTPSPQKPAAPEPKAVTETLLVASTDAACAMTVSSTTPTTIASISHLRSFVSSLGKRTIAMVNAPSQVEENAAPAEVGDGDCKDGPSLLSVAVVVQEKTTDPPTKTEHFSPQKPIKNPYLGPLKDKQPQKAIVKPQMLSHVKDSCVEQEERETFLESLKSLADSPPKALPHEEPDSVVVEDSIADSSPAKKLKVARGRGRPRGRHGKFKQAERRRSLRQQSQIEILEVIEKKAPQASEVSTSHSSEDTSSTMLPESQKSEPPASISASSIASDIVEVIEPKLDVEMPKTAPNTWSVEEVFEFIQGFPGCFDHAESFKSQEIDGQALLLIKLDHLMTGMSMKLGPAVKLIAHIRSMKEQLS